MIPTRWRLMTEADRTIRTSYTCEGDGVDACRAPASWVGERVDSHGRALAIVANRCPDHIPVRALHALSSPIITTKEDRETARSAVTTPPSREDDENPETD